MGDFVVMWDNHSREKLTNDLQIRKKMTPHLKNPLSPNFWPGGSEGLQPACEIEALEARGEQQVSRQGEPRLACMTYNLTLLLQKISV